MSLNATTGTKHPRRSQVRKAHLQARNRSEPSPLPGCHGALHRKFPTRYALQLIQRIGPSQTCHRQEAEAWVDGHQNVQVSSSSSSSQSSRPAPYQKPAHKTNSARTNGYASNSNTKDQQGAAAKGWMVAYADGSCLSR